MNWSCMNRLLAEIMHRWDGISGAGYRPTWVETSGLELLSQVYIYQGFTTSLKFCDSLTDSLFSSSDSLFICPKVALRLILEAFYPSTFLPLVHRQTVILFSFFPSNNPQSILVGPSLVGEKRVEVLKVTHNRFFLKTWLNGYLELQPFLTDPCCLPWLKITLPNYFFSLLGQGRREKGMELWRRGEGWQREKGAGITQQETILLLAG